MNRYFSGMCMLLGFIFLSCQHRFHNEKDEIAFWNKEVLDTALGTLYRTKDTTLALQYFDSVLAKSSRQSVYPQVRRWIIQANFYYFFTTNNAATARMVDSALEVLNTPELQNSYPETQVHNLLFGGDIAYRLHQYSKANSYYYKAKKLGEAYLNPCKQKSFNYSIGMVLYQQQNFREALAYFKKAFLLQNTCAPQTGAIVLQQQEIQSNIGLCHLRLGSFDSALVSFNRAKQLSLQFKDSLGSQVMDKIQGVIYGHMAQVYQAKGDLNRAKKLCFKSIALNDRPGYELQHAQQVKLQLAEIYEAQGNYTQMFELLQKMRAELVNLPNPNVALGVHRLMALYYAQAGDNQNAYAMFRGYVHLRDSLEGVQRMLSAADVNTQLNAKEKEMAIALLRKDNQITRIILWIALGAALAVATVLLLIYRNYLLNKRNLATSLALIGEINLQKEARIKEASQRHREITKAVIETQENERAAIGLELHDNVNQVLTTIKLYIGLVLQGHDKSPMLLKQSVDFLQLCIDEIRGLSRRLSAPRLGNISLEDSIDDLLNTLNESDKVCFTSDTAGIRGVALSKEHHICLYRIIQEQVNNILKHADASCVQIELTKTEDALRLIITDNGIGFHPQEAIKGIGLMNMRTRAESMSGTFELESHPGKGCRIAVVLPI